MRRLDRPSMHSWTQFGRAVRVSIEQHQNGTTVRLRTGKLNSPLDPTLLHQLTARPSDWPADLNRPSLCFRDKTTQQDRDCGHIAIAFHDGLDGHYEL